VSITGFGLLEWLFQHLIELVLKKFFYFFHLILLMPVQIRLATKVAYFLQALCEAPIAPVLSTLQSLLKVIEKVIL